MTTKKKDLTGIKFGKLTVLEETTKEERVGNKGKVTWVCICDCGNTHKATTDQLRGGKRISCGCDKIPAYEELTGRVFGELVVKHITNRRTAARQLIWWCECSCGNKVEVRADLLKSGATHSCGCRRRSKIDLVGETFGELVVEGAEPKANRDKEKNRKRWLCKCSCGNVASVSTRDLQSGRRNSCGCTSDSLGEVAIRGVLDELEVPYEQEYTFKDLYYTSESYLLRFDFAIFNESGELRGLIEYDGEQHFRPVEYFGGLKSFEETVERDQLKNNYCKENNIPLLRIPYTKYKELATVLAAIVV